MKHVALILASLLIFTTFLAIGQGTISTGKASFYANKFEGKTTASGEKYTHNKLTAAHKTLPFGTMVKVTNLTNSKSVTVRVNDRGPFIEGRIIDVSKTAAEKLNFVEMGVVDVKIEVVEESQTETTIEPTANKTAEVEMASVTEATNKPEQENTKVTEVNTIPILTTNYYQLSSAKSEPIGFGIQIASYKESGNLLERAALVESELNQKVTVQVVNSNGNRVYRLIIGEFNSRAKAEYFKDSIKDTYPGFIVAF
ncbi:MAG: septal ring lytic transglycosylase RlpA family protein [Salinivirgaceae bacterium]|nr:septal ring lytic transglycosylase RlpA family protein [Salinivirgaceae bacterium]MDD4747432.1 septal ring lytic transglycosylase RlpA family protein [Salinivirgaceae bacterium]MDY0280392.1 septal ring lytic transglycosylase RlpA family protein [Salinivirgaceae bacterium]